jgi:hypothetical protein
MASKPPPNQNFPRQGLSGSVGKCPRPAIGFQSGARSRRVIDRGAPTACPPSRGGKARGPVTAQGWKRTSEPPGVDCAASYESPGPRPQGSPSQGQPALPPSSRSDYSAHRAADPAQSLSTAGRSDARCRRARCARVRCAARASARRDRRGCVPRVPHWRRTRP